MQQVENDIKYIKDKMVEHNEADDERFSAILEKLDMNHDVHIRNEETLKQILEQAKKTNGRVGNLETTAGAHDKTIALLSQVVTQQHNQYETWVARSEKTVVTQEQFSPVKNVVYGMIALILTGVLGALMTLIIIK
jgi:uncharacterized coiled-coil protein SlyX